MSYGGQQNRTEWYDRAPSIILNQYAATIAPHVATTRWTYTVPAGRKALVESAFASMITDTVGAPAGNRNVAVAVTTTPLIQVYYSAMFPNALSSSNLAGAIILLAGITLGASTSDASTGGFNSFFVSMKATEYDA
jgi:hypothetical protein